MKFSPNIKIPDSLKRVLKRESTPTPLQEPRRPIKRNPKDNIPLNFRERSNARISLLASIVVLAILVLFFNQLDYRLIRKPAIDAQKKAAAIKEKQFRALSAGQCLYHRAGQLQSHCESEKPSSQRLLYESGPEKYAGYLGYADG